MKKQYQKPEVHYERFDRMEAIAACEYGYGKFSGPQSCWAQIPETGIKLFASGVDGCDTPYEDFEAFSNLIFSS